MLHHDETSIVDSFNFLTKWNNVLEMSSMHKTTEMKSFSSSDLLRKQQKCRFKEKPVGFYQLFVAFLILLPFSMPY